MSFIWKPRRELVMRKELYRPVDFQALLAEHGRPLSLPAVIALLNKTPRSLPIRTMQAICNALNCRLSDFCDIEPDDLSRNNPTAEPNSEQPAQSSHDVVFPDPFQFTIHDDE
jgi:hypothetical protein